MSSLTNKELAQAYAETIRGPANAWGQHVHKTLGRSDYIMLKLRERVGEIECNHLIWEAMQNELET
jgi:hypothetical protein